MKRRSWRSLIIPTFAYLQTKQESCLTECLKTPRRICPITTRTFKENSDNKKALTKVSKGLSYLLALGFIRFRNVFSILNRAHSRNFFKDAVEMAKAVVGKHIADF